MVGRRSAEGRGERHVERATSGPIVTRRGEATRERVLDAARDVFAERGVFGGTVEDICARAGFTRGAFYSNFADKDDVLRALIAREHARLLAHLDASFELVDATAAAVTRTRPAATILGHDRRPPPPVRADRPALLADPGELEIHAVRDPEVARAFLEADARFRARIAEFLERALGRFGRELVVAPDQATDAVIAIVERSTRRALLRGRSADPNALAATMLPLLVLAVSRPAGGARAG